MSLTLTAADGTRLAGREWLPHGDTRSTFVLVHGLAEHIGRYQHVAAMLTERGHRVVGFDLRGFGASEGERAYVSAWSAYLDDLQIVVEGAGSAPPLVLLGHSLGGLIALSYALSNRPEPTLLVLSAPGLDADIPRAKKVMARIMGRILPKASVDNGLRGDQLSRDPEVGERYFADPLVHTRTTLRLGREALAAGDRCRSGLEALRVPTLVLHGGADTIVPPEISEPLGDLPGVERVLLPAFRHEVFNEERGREATRLVADWVETRL